MAKKKSETKTENLFRSFYGTNTFLEKSAIPDYYGFTSKRKTGEKGYPDFFKDCDKYCIIVEAKADNFKLAIDEVKWYMEHNLIENKDIIGIAISGQTKDSIQIKYFCKLLIDDNLSKIDNLTDAETILSLNNIEKIYTRKKYGDTISDEALTTFLSELNKKFHDKSRVRDTNRSLFFSGLMIALNDKTFQKTYRSIEKPESGIEAGNLNEAILTAITNQLKDKANSFSKKIVWKDCFAFIRTISFPLIEYKRIIKDIEEKIFIPFKHEEKYDILGKAYKIFLSRAGKIENKNIILTPDHIKDLMVKLANLSVDDVVLDTCTGPGGFLMFALEKLVSLANGDDDTIEHITNHQLIGFEIDPVLYSLACSNMFLHGDGRSNMIHRSSLLDVDNLVEDDGQKLLDHIHKLKPRKCIINPPYENNLAFEFVWSAIDYLEPDGELIVIMPSITLEQNQEKSSKRKQLKSTENLLKKATLNFEIKMPPTLFREQGRTIQTSIFGFTKKPHNQDKNVLFYNLKDDGLESVQHKGRVDTKKQWPQKEEEIFDCVLNGTEIPGKSYKRKIFIKGKLVLQNKQKTQKGFVPIGDLFNVIKDPQQIQSTKNVPGDIPFITAAIEWKTHNKASFKKTEALVYVVGAEGSLGNCHYINGDFTASSLCLVLTEKDKKQYPVNLKFYQLYFESIKQEVRKGLNGWKKGKSKQSISQSRFETFEIPYVDINKQNQVVKKVEKIKKDLEEIEKKKIELDKQLNQLVVGSTDPCEL